VHRGSGDREEHQAADAEAEQGDSPGPEVVEETDSGRGAELEGGAGSEHEEDRVIHGSIVTQPV